MNDRMSLRNKVALVTGAGWPMTASGQTRPKWAVRAMPVLPPIATQLLVADLEARLGVKLLLRTTRHVTPTDAGRVFLERARQILGDLDDAENAASGVDSLRGTLRVALSGAFGTREVIPRLPGFAAQHPKLGIELLMSDRTEDLIAEEADMALRLGSLPDSGFGARLLGKAPRLVVAAPAYTQARGRA